MTRDAELAVVEFDLEKKEESNGQKEWVYPDTRLWDEMMEKMKTVIW